MTIETTLPDTTDRVPANTAEEINRRIEWETECRVAHYVDHPAEIGRRLEELDREWDIERMIEANAGAIALTGMVLGMARRRWLLLPLMVSGFLLQHAVQGWCPPVPILRRLGFRTADEIAHERYALKALRGDFDGKLPATGGSPRERARRLLEIARA